jgi:hypothetical protein
MTMKLQLHIHIQTTSRLHDFIVLRQSVHHVVLSLFGQNSQKLNPPATFFAFWSLCSQMRTQGQHMSALTRHVWYFDEPLLRAAGTTGGAPQDLLLTHTITSIIGLKTTFVTDGAILLH